MNKIVKVVYNADTLQTEITVDGKPFDTTRINGKEIADWAYPFMIRKIKWNGFYDEIIEALDGEKEFNLVFDGSENDLNELKEAWEDAPVTIISEGDLENIVVIDYNENTLTTNIIVNNQPFDTSRINGREIEDWIYPFMIRKVKWDGIFEELAKFLDSVEYTIQFSGSNAAMQELMSECPETVSIKKLRTVKSETIQDNETPKSKETTEIPKKEILLSQLSAALTNVKEELLKKLCIALSNRCYYINYLDEIYPKLADARNNTDKLKINDSYDIIEEFAELLGDPEVNKSGIFELLPEPFKKEYSVELNEFVEKMKKEHPRLSEDELDRLEYESKVKLEHDLYSEGKRLFDCKEYEEAVQWFEKAAESKNGLALKALGECYFYGYGVTKSYKKAYKWYKNALKELPGDADVMYMMGYFYHHSIGVEADLDEAARWYKKAKSAGNKKADAALKEVENKIAENYYWSARVKENEGNDSEALSLYKKSAELGYAPAMYDMGLFYRYGVGIDKNPRKAIDWYKKGSDNGNSFCQYELADCYWEGEGVKLNKSLAFDLFQKSARQGNADANNRLGLIYSNGDFKKKDITKAIEYYQTAAEMGSKFAMYNLGVTLYDEMNDIDSAKKWLEKSLEAGCEDAQEMLDRIEAETDSEVFEDIHDEENYEYDHNEETEPSGIEINLPEPLDTTYSPEEHEDYVGDNNCESIVSDIDLLVSAVEFINTDCIEKANDFFKRYSSSTIEDYKTLEAFIDEFLDMEIKSIAYDEDIVHEDIAIDFVSKLATGLEKDEHDKHDKNVVVEILEWFSNNVLDMIISKNENDFQNVISYLESVKPRLMNLIEELKEDFNSNCDKIFEFFVETDINSSEDSYIVPAALHDYFVQINNKCNRELKEIESTDKKANAATTVGGAIAGGLLSFIPVVGIPLAVGAGALGGKLISDNISDKYNEIFRKYSYEIDSFFYRYISIYVLWLSSDKILEITNYQAEEYTGLGDIDFDENDNFFDEI